MPRFKKEKVVLAIENHNRFRAKELVEIIRATDEGWVGICLDTANSLGADEGIYEVIEMQEPEEHFQVGDALTKVLFQPVTTNHPITVEQMAIL